MKAITYEQYGPAEVMNLKDIPVPEATNNKVLVKVEAASVNPVDWLIRNGDMKIMTGKKLPRGMGEDFAGIVESIGPDVTSLKKGDEVFGWCPYKTAGSFAEYVVVLEDTVMKKPDISSFEQAACFPMAGITAYKAFVNTAKLKTGEKVLVNGCTGGVGLFALQIAKAFGAIVTGTCSTKNIEIARQFGADEVIDYRETNILQTGKEFDVILEASAKLKYKSAKKILSGNGRFLDLNPVPSGILKSIFSSKYFAVMTAVDNSDLAQLSQLAADGKLRAHVEKTVPLDKAIDSLKEMEDSRTVIGKTVITMQ